MPSIQFEGDWTPEEVVQYSALLKSGQQPAALFPALEDEPEPYDWSAYESLSKSVGDFKTDPKTGSTYRMNSHNRWEKLKLPSGKQNRTAAEGGFNIGQFQFPLESGEFGQGVYLHPRESQDYMVLRVRIDCLPEDLITRDEFEALEDDLTNHLDLVLDSRGVRGVLEDDIVMLRSSSDLIPLGLLGGSGAMPSGEFDYALIDLIEMGNHLQADIELQPVELPQHLAKAARKTIASASHLDGTKLRPVRHTLDRNLVRDAVKGVQLRGVDLDDIRVCVVKGVPSFLPDGVAAYCLPSDQTVNICPHDPALAITGYCRQLGRRLHDAMGAGAVMPDAALDVMIAASALVPERWLEMLITQYAGAVLSAKSGINDGEIAEGWQRYIALLSARGVEYWGNRQTIAQCMAEDYRCCFYPELPNAVTLEWDLAVPAVARMAQQTLLTLIHA